MHDDLIATLSNQKTGTFSVAEMLAAVQAKKARRAAKGAIFNCIVIDCDAATDSFTEFIQNINEHISSGTGRFQVIYKINRIHWSCADVQINAGQLSIFLIDAAGILKTIEPFVAEIQRHTTTATIYYSGGKIQTNLTDCATFALDHAFCLSKIKALHQQLSDMTVNAEAQTTFRQSFSIHELDATTPFAAVQFIPFSDFPVEWGCLVRNMQNIRELDFFIDNKKGDVSWQGNADETLKIYFFNRSTKVTPHTQKQQRKKQLLKQWYPTIFTLNTSYTKPEDFSKPENFFKNANIDWKRISIRNKTIDYLKATQGKLQNSIMFGEEKIVWGLSSLVAASKRTEIEMVSFNEKSRLLSFSEQTDTKPPAENRFCCPRSCTLL